MGRVRARCGIGLIAAILTAAACGPSVETYEARGVVEAVDSSGQRITIAHREIPGLMSAMTMNFDLAPELFEGIEPGMAVEFTLEKDGRALRITRIEPVEKGGASDTGASGRSGLALPPGRTDAPVTEVGSRAG